MNVNAKRVIKGIAKTTGKYTLKGLGKGLELAGRGTIKTVNALVKNKKLQKIAIGAGVLAASVAIPEVGVGMISAVAAKYMIDKVLGKNKNIIDEVGDIMKPANLVTNKVCKKIISPTLGKADKKIKSMGSNYQSKIDSIFR